MKTMDDLHDEDDNLENEEGTAGEGNTGGEGKEGATDGEGEGSSNARDFDPNTDDPDKEESSDEEESGGGEESSNDDEASGIEQFLAQYGISGGIITFEADEDGGEAVQKHFNELTSEEQSTILMELAASGAPAVESKYGLDEDEIGLLNFVRQHDGGVEAAIEELAQSRLAQLQALEDATGVDYNSMSDEAVVAKWLKENNPEATEEELAQELERSKDSSFFEKNAATIRSGFIDQQIKDAELEEARYKSMVEAELEEDRVKIASAVSELDNIVGFKIDDKAKNEVLGKILEVNDNNDSLFMEEVFGDPEKLFRAAWLYYNGEAYFDQMEKHYKRELANEYQKGRRHAIEGLPSDPISQGGGVNGENSGGDNKVKREPTQNGKTVDDIWAND